MNSTTTSLISAHHLYHRFGDKEVLQDISLTLKAGEIVTLIGPNGAGKSTLLKLLLKLLEPTSGQVKHRPNLRIGFMPQKIQLDESLPLSVMRFLQLGLPKKGKNHDHSAAKASIKKTNDTTDLMQIITDLKLDSILNHPIQQISGGEMQRVLLARALLRSPELLVLDEPVQGVDIQGQTELYHYITEIRDTYDCGILMVSHDLHIVMKNTDHVLCLNQHLCCSGHPQDISNAPEFQALFGQEVGEIAVYEHHHNHRQCDHTHGNHTHVNKEPP